jgi:outer membrane lipoprotein-sorting protein
LIDDRITFDVFSRYAMNFHSFKSQSFMGNSFYLKVVSMLLFLMGNVLLEAQPGPGKKPEVYKDQEAVRILSKLKKQFDSYKSLEIQFLMETEIPGSPGEKQQGKLIQEGAKYHVQTDQYVIICDAKTMWFINRQAKEGQINKVGDDDGMGLFSPLELMKIYEKDNHNIGLVNEFTEKGKVFQEIEFVPRDRGADYSKARLILQKATQELSEVRFFNKDGSRMVLRIKSLQANKTVSADQFVFKSSQFPGVHMEDLR